MNNLVKQCLMAGLGRMALPLLMWPLLMMFGAGLMAPEVEADSYGFAMRDAKEKVAVAVKRMNLGLYRGDWVLAGTSSQEMLSLADWISPDQRDMARYVRVGALLQSPDVAALGQAHDLALAIQQSPELKGMAQAQVLVAMDKQGVKPELLAFVADQARDYLAYMNGDLVMSGRRQVLLLDTLTSLRLLDMNVLGGVERAFHLPLGSPEQAVYLVRRALSGVTSNSTDTRMQLTRRTLPNRTVTVLMAETLFTEAMVLRQLRADAAYRSVVSGLDRLLQRHVLALRAWQQPHRLLEMITAWQRRVVMPDSGQVDEALMTLVGCGRQKGNDALIPLLPIECTRSVLGYLQPVFSDSVFRMGIHNYHELSVNLSRLENVLTELEVLAEQDFVNQNGFDVDEENHEIEGQLAMLPKTLENWFDQNVRIKSTKSQAPTDVTPSSVQPAVQAYKEPHEITIGQLREAGWLLYRLLEYQRERQQSHLLSLLIRQLAYERQRLEGYRERLALPLSEGLHRGGF